MRNTINRISQRTSDLDGGLFAVNEWWLINKTDNGADISVYAMTTGNEGQVQTWLEHAIEGGYGADSSVGLGWMEIIDITETSLPSIGERAMALAAFIPETKDSISDLCADTRTKFGKLGAEMAQHTNPFKKPLVMYRAGATFSAAKNRPTCIGSIKKGIHADASIRHLAMAPLMYFSEEEKKCEYLSNQA
ncbi:MAG TPA: hypothetical protein ENN79_07055 [Desulfobacteraceae bacterium]|nr:hypothetical protein [Desulfobacteraceae bacterium]